MRVLVVSAPLAGHVFPMVPLASALRDAGHEVLVATAGDGLAAADAGLRVEDVAPRFRFGRIASRVMLRHPLIARAELAGAGGTGGVSLLFAGVNAELAAPVVALAERWRPELVVYEPLAVAGALAAARCGVPAVLHENSLYDGAELVRVTAARLTSLFRRYGVDALPPAAARLAVAPPSLVGARTGWPMRCLAYSGEGDAPGWLSAPGARPRILVSRSTLDGPGNRGLMPALVAVAPAVDAEFVLVRPERTGSLPDNVRAVGRVPLSRVLPGCAGIVHHGGAGTVLAALAAGVPQLVTPGSGDRTLNARLVAERGAGLAVPAKSITAADLTRLVTDDTLVAAATEVGAEMAAMPEPGELVTRLESLRD